MNEAMVLTRTRWYGFLKGVAIALTAIDTALGAAFLFKFWGNIQPVTVAWLILALGAFVGAWTRFFQESQEHRETVLRTLCYLYMTGGFLLLAVGGALAGR